MNLPLIDQVIEDLNHRRGLIVQALDGLAAIKELYSPGSERIDQAPFTNATLEPATPPTVLLGGERQPSRAKASRKSPPNQGGDSVEPKPKRKYKKRAAATERTCAKHPGNTEWEGKKGSSCAPCRREYQKNRRLTKGAKPRGGVARSAGVVAEPKTSVDHKLHQLANMNRPKEPAAVGDELEYSKLLTCSKCRATNVRYSRREDADPAVDSWMCPSGCTVRISHVLVKVDRNYRPAA